MSILISELDANSSSFATNRTAMQKAIDEMRAVQQKVLDKSFEAKPKFDKRGKILPHERIKLLLDAGSPFVELCGFVGYQMFDDKDGSDAGGGVISGISSNSSISAVVRRMSLTSGWRASLSGSTTCSNSLSAWRSSSRVLSCSTQWRHWSLFGA